MQIKDYEVWEIVEEMKKSAGLSEGTYPKAKDSGEIFSAFRQLIHVCGDSFFHTREGASPEGFGRVVFMGPVSRGSKVYLFTRSTNNVFEESSPRTVVSYGVDYLNPEAVSEAETTYLFRIALARAEKGKKLADLPEVVSPYSDGGRWNRNGDRITIYPCVDDASKHLYSTDISNIISEVSDPKVISVVVDEVADVENCIPAIRIQMSKNGTSSVTLKIKDADGNILHTRTFTVAVNNPEWNTKPVTGVSVSQSSISGLAGHTCQLSATVSPATATNKGITWSSSDQAVARVDQNGLVTLIGAGKASITVTTVDGAKTAYTEVNVNAVIFKMAATNGQEEFPDTVSTNDSKWNTANNRFVVYPFTTNGTSSEWYYTSGTNILHEVSKPDVLSISMGTMNGGKTPAIIISFLKNGNSKVTLSIKNDDGAILHTRTFTVSVNNPAWNKISVTGVSLPNSSISLLQGQSHQLTATVLPNNATEKKIIWSSSSPSVVSTNQNGLIKGIARGTGKITVTTVDGGKIAYADITVSTPIFTMVTFQPLSNGMRHAEFPDTVNPFGSSMWDWNSGSSAYELTVMLCQINGTKMSPILTDTSNLQYEVSNRDILSITTGKRSNRISCFYIKMLKNGSSNVTLRLKDNGGSILLSRTFTVNVANPEWSKVAVTGVSLPVSSISLIVGQKRQISPTVLPSNATNKKVIWSYSGTPSTAASTIDQTGMLTACKAGSNTIYAKTQDGSKQASTVVKVTELLFRMWSTQPENGYAYVVFPDTISSKDSKWQTKNNRLTVCPAENNGSSINRYFTEVSNILYEVSNPNIVSISITSTKVSGQAHPLPGIDINLLKTGTSRVTLKIKDSSGSILHTRTFTVNVVK